MKRIFTKLAVLFMIAFTGNVYCQSQQTYWDFDKWGEVYFSFQTNNEKDLESLSRLISIDKYEDGTVIAYANERTFNLFLDYGYTPTILAHPSTLEPVKMYTLEQFNAKEEYEWNSYPTYPAFVAMMDEFEVTYPTLCTTMRMGNTVQNRELIISKITSQNNPTTKSRILLTGTMHGDETTGYILLLRMIDYLCSNYEVDPRITSILDNAEIWICPLANPDGTYHGGDNTVFGSQRYNGAYVDLNRNYKDDVYGDHPDGEEWQPETIAFMDLVDSVQFSVGFNLHGGAEVCNYPWDNKSARHADNAWWIYVCREYADTTHVYNPNYMTDLNNGITNGYDWYTITGSRQDNANAFHNLKEFTLEISTTKTLNGSQLPAHWNWNYRSMLNFIEQGLYGIHGSITDASTGNPIENCKVMIENHDTNGSHSVSDNHGYYVRPIKAGTYDVTYIALGYEPVTIPITITDKETIIQDVELTYTGITIDFEASATDIALGTTVNFTDLTYSQDPIVSYYWEFPGGNPSTSTEQNPSVLYEEEGTFNVSLTVTSESETGTIVKENYINVTNMYMMQNGTFVTDGGMFYDDGGPNGNYSNNKNLVMTFTPHTQGASMVFEFSSFQLENNYDKLFIYNGPTVSSPSLGTFTGNNGPGTITSTAEDGSLTFKFTSDGSVNKAGWAASISTIGGQPCDAPELTGEVTFEEGVRCTSIAWNSVENAIGYNVYENGNLIETVQEIAFVVSDIENDNVYCYQVSTICEGGESELSNEVCLSYLLGDANNDNNVDVTDVMTLVNYITESQPAQFNHINADVNGDASIDVADIVATIQVIYSGKFNNARCSYSNDSVIFTIENRILYIENSVEISGIQFNIETNDNTIETESVLQNFETAFGTTNGNKHIFIAYTMNGQPIPAGKHAIANVKDATIDNVIFSNPWGCKVDAIDGNIVGINELSHLSNPFPSPFNKELNIPYTINDNVKSAEIVINNISGQEVATFNVDSSVGQHTFKWDATETLTNGVYIITLKTDNVNRNHFKVVYNK